MTNAIPIILCGRTTQIGTIVSKSLRPEYEVVHFIQSFQEADKEIPLILGEEKPEIPVKEGISTGNYENAVRAVVAGRAFSPEQVTALRLKCAGLSKVPVVWLAGDPADAPKTTAMPGPGYGEAVARDVKKTLGDWFASNPTEDETITY